MICGAAEGGVLPLPEVKRGVRRGMIDGIEVLQLCLPYSNYDSFSRRILIFIRFACSGISVALREQYDLLFATSTPLTIALPGIIAKWLRRKPFVFEIRDPWPEVPRALGVIKNPAILLAARWFEKLAYRQANASIGLSPGMVEGIRGVVGSDKSVTLIPNGCDLDRFRPRSAKDRSVFGVSPFVKFVAVYAGAHGMANGLGAVLDAAACLNSMGRVDIAIVFIGDGREKPGLMRRAKDEGLGNCIFIPPIAKERVADILPHADAGLMIFDNVPIFYYGTSPNKFFDYIASGLPVINNYPGWLKEMIEKHGCGTAVSPEKPEALAAALIQLADDESTDRRRVAINARTLAEQHFDRKKLASHFADVLEHVVSTERSLY